MVAFGTSGLRGLISELTDEVAFGHTLAFLSYLKDSGEFTSGTQVIIGGDLRPSTPRLLKAVWTGVEAAAGVPVYAGFLPSPAVALAGALNHGHRQSHSVRSQRHQIQSSAWRVNEGGRAGHS